MTDLELLRHARSYVIKLGNGVHPVTGEPLTEQNIRDERLLKCYFYIADAIDSIISEREKPKTKRIKQAFSLQGIDFTRFSYSNTPISISEFVKRVNTLKTDDQNKTLSYLPVREYLCKNGYLEKAKNDNGKDGFAPTEKGKSIGISLEHRTGANGPYNVVLYALNAQKFMIEHLPIIISTSIPGQMPWSKEHDATVLELYEQDVPIQEIAITLKRSEDDVLSRLKVLREE